MRRIATGVLALAAVVMATASAGAEKVVIHQLGWIWHGDPWHQYMDARIAEFEKLHPDVKIERTIAGAPGQAAIEDKFTAMVAGGIAPDVTEFALSGGGGMAPKGVFMDLRPFFAKDSSLKLADFAKPAVDALTWADGTLWGMPMDVYPVTTYYNATMFGQMGLRTPKEVGPNGWTWDYAMNAAKKFTQDTNGDGKLDRWGFANAWMLVSYTQSIKQAGGSLYDRQVDPTKAMLNDPRTIKGLEWVADIYGQHINAPDYDVNFGDGTTAFDLGQGPTGIGAMNQVAKFDWGVASPLQGPDNNGGYIAVNSVQMTKYTKQPDIVWEWLKFLASDRENIQDFVRRTTRVPAYLPMLPQYPKLIAKAPDGINNLSDVIMNPKSWHPSVGPTTSRIETLIFNGFMSNVVAKGKGVRPVFEALNSQVQAILDQGRKSK